MRGHSRDPAARISGQGKLARRPGLAVSREQIQRESVEPGVHRRMGGEHVAGARGPQGLAEIQPVAARELARPLQHGEGGVSLVQVADLDLRDAAPRPGASRRRPGRSPASAASRCRRHTACRRCRDRPGRSPGRCCPADKARSARRGRATPAIAASVLAIRPGCAASRRPPRAPARSACSTDRCTETPRAAAPWRRSSGGSSPPGTTGRCR